MRGEVNRDARVANGTPQQDHLSMIGRRAAYQARIDGAMGT